MQICLTTPGIAKWMALGDDLNPSLKSKFDTYIISSDWSYLSDYIHDMYLYIYICIHTYMIYIYMYICMYIIYVFMYNYTVCIYCIYIWKPAHFIFRRRIHTTANKWEALAYIQHNYHLYKLTKLRTQPRLVRDKLRIKILPIPTRIIRQGKDPNILEVKTPTKQEITTSHW